ncbi:hypothetical protein O3P69_020277 [Scylla paramamosain]|uniref:Uncharacterized protein n=1 Tax=Scylla paramamosain TaxID=85552 RepID=A0AAW0TLW7_SCYPA
MESEMKVEEKSMEKRKEVEEEEEEESKWSFIGLPLLQHSSSTYTGGSAGQRGGAPQSCPGEGKHGAERPFPHLATKEREEKYRMSEHSWTSFTQGG